MDKKPSNLLQGRDMKHLDTVKLMPDDSLGVATARPGADSLLLGSVAQRDSMAVIGAITALADHFGIDVEDGDISARRCATVGSLAAFVQEMPQP
jgi:acyl carrier protein